MSKSDHFRATLQRVPPNQRHRSVEENGLKMFKFDKSSKNAKNRDVDPDPKFRVGVESFDCTTGRIGVGLPNPTSPDGLF